MVGNGCCKMKYLRYLTLQYHKVPKVSWQTCVGPGCGIYTIFGRSFTLVITFKLMGAAF